MGPGRVHVGDQIDLYLTGALTPDEEEAFEEHLLFCASCRAEADQSSAVAVAVAGLPPDIADEVVRRGPVPPRVPDAGAGG